MGLSVTLSNALSGMRIGQSALDVLSHNVANAGTPGYHRRSISVIDTKQLVELIEFPCSDASDEEF